MTEENVEELPQPEPDEDITLRYDPVQIAQEVVAGRWSRGHRRTTKLVAAGYDPDLIAFHVRLILNPNF